MSVTAYTGATVIDGEGGKPLPSGVVLTDLEGKILATGAASAVPVPSGAAVVDLTGKWLLPGLMDANVHLLPWPSWTYIEFLARYEHRFEEVITEAAQVALAAGFTTVFDSMGPLDSLMAVRDRIASGQVPGARIYAAGNIVGFRAVFTTAESMACASRAFQRRINDRFEAGGGPEVCELPPRELYARMRDYVAQGADFVKYGATGDGDPVNSEIGQASVLRFSPDQQAAIVEAVHSLGKTVQTHTTSAESLHIAVSVGNDMGQHASFTGRSRMYDETLALMQERGYFCGTQWAPLSEEGRRRVAERDFSGIDGATHGLDNLENSVRLIDAGVPQLVSTDAGTIDPDVAADEHQWGGLGGHASLIGEAEFLNMRAMAERGMTPMQIVQAATLNIARAYKVDAELGSLAAGKRADMVVLDADPLASAENMRSVSMVIKDGVIVERAALPSPRVLPPAGAVALGRVRAG